jgi:hypothetical protein
MLLLDARLGVGLSLALRRRCIVVWVDAVFLQDLKFSSG